MKKKVLIVYASKYGATAEIALHIGKVIQDNGVLVEVKTVEQVEDLTSYQAVVLGSAVYAGQWLREAANFLTTNEPALTERPVWIFSSGPTGEGDPVELMKGWVFPENLRPVADRIQPRDIAIFNGVLDPKKLNLPEKMIIKALKSPTGDFRDWDAITSWASSIAESLQPGEGGDA
jgi:menaquinone-dependent protoporphyrinogen oxidase